jgi:L,D-transpeptidase catalytic domain
VFEGAAGLRYFLMSRPRQSKSFLYRASYICVLPLAAAGAVLFCACGAALDQPLPSAADQPRAAAVSTAKPAVTNAPASPSAVPPTATSSSTGTPIPATEVAAASSTLEGASALALGGGTPVRSSPSMSDGTTVRTLSDRQALTILGEVRGERWVVGDQTWPMALQDWTNLWYRVDGGYVYAGFVYIPRPGEIESLDDRSAAHWVDVDLNAQTATAMIGDRAVHEAQVTTGKPGYETPGGDHSIQYRKFNETMTSSQAAIQDPNEQYDVRNVLYTQYFDSSGDALHLNYWQPDAVFGRQRSSHGCVGLQLHDAQFLWLFADAGSKVSIHPVSSSTATPTSTPTTTATASATATSLATPSPASTSAAQPAASPTPLQEPGGASLPPLPPPPVFPGSSTSH